MSKELSLIGHSGVAESVVKFRGGFMEIFSNPNYVSLNTLQKKHDRLIVKQAIGLLIADKFDKGIDYNEDILDLVTEFILTNHPDVSLQDITYFANTVMSGKWKLKLKVFKYDAPTINAMWTEFIKEREEQLIHIRENKNSRNDILISNELSTEPKGLPKIERTPFVLYRDIIDYCERHGYDEHIYG